MTLAAVLPRVRRRRRKPWSPVTRFWFWAATFHFGRGGGWVTADLVAPTTSILPGSAFGISWGAFWGWWCWRRFQVSRRRDED